MNEGVKQKHAGLHSRYAHLRPGASGIRIRQQTEKKRTVASTASAMDRGREPINIHIYGVFVKKQERQPQIPGDNFTSRV